MTVKSQQKGSETWRGTYIYTRHLRMFLVGVGRSMGAVRLIRELINGKEGLKEAQAGELGEVGRGAVFWGFDGKEANALSDVRVTMRGFLP